MNDYLHKKDPTIEDWIKINAPFFEWARTGVAKKFVIYAILTDFDRHAERAGRDVDEYFDELVERVGDLGRFRLVLVRHDDEAFVSYDVKQEDGAR